LCVLETRGLRARGVPRAVTCQQSLLVAVDDAPTREVVWTQLNDDAILWEDPDVMLAHLARDMGKHPVSVGEFNTKHRVGQGFDHCAFDLDDAVFFGHSPTVAKNS
jgi:hypothetical protein